MILENSEGLTIEVSLTFSFSTSSNQAECEACIAGLLLAREFNVVRVEHHLDSLLVVSQIKELFDAKDSIMEKYLARVRELLKLFENAEVKHVPRSENTRADILSKLASTKSPGNHRSVVQETLSRPSVSQNVPPPPEVCVIDPGGDWIDPILKYVVHGEEPEDPKEAALTRRRVTSNSFIEGKLFRRGLSMPLLKCLGPKEADYVLHGKYMRGSAETT